MESKPKSSNPEKDLEKKMQYVISKGILSDTNKYLFGLPDNVANEVLKYFNRYDMMSCFRVNKTWKAKINKSQHFQSVLAMWFLYGHGNAERLSNIVDQVIREVEIYQKLYNCKGIDAIKEAFLNVIKDEKKGEYNFNCSLYAQLMRSGNGTSEIKILLWHMILIGILTIKKSDLNFDFETKKMPLTSICHDSIYNYVSSDKFKNKILSFLAVDHWSLNLVTILYDFFSKSLDLTSKNGTMTEFVEKTCVCFLKVAFYQMKSIMPLKKRENEQLLSNWRETVYSLKKLFYGIDDPQKHIWRKKSMAQYLYLTGELDRWWKDYRSEFIGYFASNLVSLDKDYYLTDNNKLDFNDFLAYLNKIEPISERYKKHGKRNDFWPMFFPDRISDIRISIFNGRGLLFLQIAAYLSSDQEKRVWQDMRIGYLTRIIDNYGLLQLICNNYGKDCKDDYDKFQRCVFDSNRQMKIDEREVSSYFDTLIISFFEMEGKDLSNDNKYFIKYVSNAIINNQDARFKKSPCESQNQNKISFINEKSDEVYIKNDNIEYLFGFPDADKVLGYLDLKDMYNYLIADKTWNSKINKSNHFQNFILAFIMRFIYGRGNAERLSYTIDKSLEKVEIYKKLCKCKRPGDLKEEFLNLVKKDGKKEKYDFYKSQYVEIMRTKGVSEIRILLWHMILIGILSIKKSDLNFDFETKKMSLIDFCNHLIYNYVASDKFKNKILRTLATEDCIRCSDMLLCRFFSESLKIDPKVDNQPEFFKKICVCFLKVAFYQMERLLSSKEQKDTKFLSNWRNFAYNLKRCFYFRIRNGSKTMRTKSMVQYLYLTGELEYWWKGYKDEFIGYFGSNIVGLGTAQVPGLQVFESNKLHLQFDAFLPYLNKIEPLSERYKDTKNFWEMFFPAQMPGYELVNSNNRGKLFISITGYLSSDQAESVLKYMNVGNLKWIISREQFLKNMREQYGYDIVNNEDKLKRCLVNINRREKIDEEEVGSYFDALIVRCFEMEGKDLPNDNKDFIKYVSKAIINSLDARFKKSQYDPQNQNKISFINEKSDKVYIKNNNIEKENSQLDDKKEKQNLNKINFMSEKSNDRKNKMFTDKNMKTPMNLDKRSVLDKTNQNPDQKIPELSPVDLKQKD